MVEYAKKHGATRVGLPITTTYSANLETQEIDIEYYFPIDRVISSERSVIFKPKLCLYNCIKISHKGHPNKIEKAYNKINKYITDNALIAISSAFNVTVKDVTDINDIEQFEADVYVSINPNVF